MSSHEHKHTQRQNHSMQLQGLFSALFRVTVPAVVEEILKPPLTTKGESVGKGSNLELAETTASRAQQISTNNNKKLWWWQWCRRSPSTTVFTGMFILKEGDFCPEWSRRLVGKLCPRYLPHENLRDVKPWAQAHSKTKSFYVSRAVLSTFPRHRACCGRGDPQTAAHNKGWVSGKRVEFGACGDYSFTSSKNLNKP